MEQYNLADGHLSHGNGLYALKTSSISSDPELDRTRALWDSFWETEEEALLVECVHVCEKIADDYTRQVIHRVHAYTNLANAFSVRFDQTEDVWVLE
jgi:hypothetical protein